MKKINKLEAVLWNIALPGFSQLLTGELYKGTLFILLEVIINVSSKFNTAIMLSFNWKIDEAIHVINYQWLMFYPCLYMFAMWDAYRHAMPEDEQYSFLPFAFGAYFVTVGLMYSKTLTLGGILFGPVFLPMLFLIPGLIVGFILRSITIMIKKRKFQI